jgi:hypothetical protein
MSFNAGRACELLVVDENHPASVVDSEMFGDAALMCVMDLPV